MKKYNAINNKKLNGSLTIETSLVLPLFMFFCIQFMSIISIMQVHSALEAAMHQEVAAASLRAYTLGKAGVDGVVPAADTINEVVMRKLVIDRAGREYLDKSMIKGGSGGISLVLSLPDGGQDVVDLILSYRVKPAVDILGFSEFALGNRCRMKKWTGYVHGGISASETQEEMVYVTETGTVYHKNRNCTHLMLSIHSVSRGELPHLRSDDGSKYYPCEHCGLGGNASVFITDQGNRYHTSLSCSGLKRTVYTVGVSEVAGMGGCQRCGG